MRRALRLVALAGVALFGAWAVGRTDGQQASEPATSARGGALAKTARHRFEVFFYTTGLRVFPVDSVGTAIDASRLTGTATFYHPNSPRAWFERPLHAAPTGAGQPSPSLDVVIDLSKVPPTGARVTFQIEGVPDPAEAKATFTVPFEFVPTIGEPSASQASEGATPRYTYGPGYYGYGYYQNAGPQAAPAPDAGARGYQTYGAPGGHLGHAPTYDWSVGRDNPLAKPWLRPWD
jgi:hypothetical protein